MDTAAAIERIGALLDDTSEETSNTSMRIPRALRAAAALAVEHLGVAPSVTTLTSAALRAAVEAVVAQAALDVHYLAHPEARPSLGDLAVATAEIEGNPLASRPDLIRRSAVEILAVRPEAGPDDVLLWAQARSLPAA